MLLGAEAMKKLAEAHVAIFGLGGVGGYVCEALARSGVGALTLIDRDVISESNCNRQILATGETVGRLKAEVAKERVLAINPSCRAEARVMFYLPENSDGIDLSAFDYIVDAVDTVTAKLFLIGQAQAAGTPVISSMGTGNKLDPAAFRVADIYHTSVCPLAKIMRKESRRRGLAPYKVVYSTEDPAEPDDGLLRETPDPGRHSIPASIAFVPAAAGLLLASEVIRDLIRQ